MPRPRSDTLSVYAKLADEEAAALRAEAKARGLYLSRTVELALADLYARTDFGRRGISTAPLAPNLILRKFRLYRFEHTRLHAVMAASGCTSQQIIRAAVVDFTTS